MRKQTGRRRQNNETQNHQPLPVSSSRCWPMRRRRSPSKQFDRSKIPPPAKPPVLRVPAWTKSTLANGADLIVSEKHDLPLVSFTITFQGGSSQAEAATRRGVAGTDGRDDERRNEDPGWRSALQRVAASRNDGQRQRRRRDRFDRYSIDDQQVPQTLDILADMLVNPAFPAEALERLRAQRLVALTQGKDQTATIASACVSQGALWRRSSLWSKRNGRHA